MLVWFLPLFLVFLMIGLPVFFALLAAPGLLLWLAGSERDFVLLYRNMYNGMDSFPLMAIPFFMLAGEMMNRGGITLRLVEFSQACVGHFRAGLAQVNILSSMLFAGLSGSAVADTSALGSMLIPAMESEGYTRRFAAAVTAASSVIGPIIPPSGIMIIYAYVMEESVAALFLAGIVPGVLVGLGLMIVTNVIARRAADFPDPAAQVDLGRAGPGVAQGVLPAAHAGDHPGRHPRRHLHAYGGERHRRGLCSGGQPLRAADDDPARHARRAAARSDRVVGRAAAGRRGDVLQDGCCAQPRAGGVGGLHPVASPTTRWCCCS